MARHKKYFRADLEVALKRWVENNGRVPTSDEFRVDKNMPSLNAYLRVFGTFTKALIACGFEPVGMGRRKKTIIS